MRFRTRALVFGYPLAELLVAFGVAQVIGWGSTILLLLLGIPVGAAVMSKASRARPLWFLAGILIAIPGFITDILGAVVCLPVVHRWVMRRGYDWLDANVSFLRFSTEQGESKFADGDVIPGTVIYPPSEQDEGHPRGWPSITDE